MIIKGIKYSRYSQMPREWSIAGKDDQRNEDYARFENLNLLVGKNATGKSRTLAAIYELATLISGRSSISQARYHTQSFDFIFDDDGDHYRYVLSFREKQIEQELLYINNNVVLDRNNGFIVALGEKKKITSIDNQTLLVNKERGNGDYYFTPLVVWAISLRTFMFSDQYEKNRYIEDLSSISETDQNIEDIGIIIPIFHWGRKEYGQKFEDEIIECMNESGYRLTDIDIKKNKLGYSINVEEDGKYMVSQQEMSQGMFRSLALFVLIINARWRKLSVCILVDDIGEGLDHERSKASVDLIIQKTYNTNIQYFMTTNDRYVMNQIHLKYWSVIEIQTTSKSVFYNIQNSEQNFEDFKYTGLNNFDFFTTDFYKDGFGEDEEGEENNKKTRKVD